MNEETQEAPAEAPVEAPAEATEAVEPSEPSEPPSIRDAIENAFEQVDKADEPGRPRDDQGRYTKEASEDDETPAAEAETAPAEAEAETEDEAPAEPEAAPAPFAEPPARFSGDAKEVWSAAPDPVKAEITRAVQELEGGIEQYRGVYEPFKQFDEAVRENGQDPAQVLERYTGLEQQLMANPMQGLEAICQNLGTTLTEVAAAVLQRPPEQAAVAQEQTIGSLRQEIQALQAQIGNVTETIKTDKDQMQQAELAEFAKEHPRFEELRQDMAMFVEHGRTSDLAEAYKMAEQLNPAAAIMPPPEPKPAEAQTRKGKLSVTGAPSSGSDPDNRKPSKTTRDAIAKSFAQAGIV